MTYNWWRHDYYCRKLDLLSGGLAVRCPRCSGQALFANPHFTYPQEDTAKHSKVRYCTSTFSKVREKKGFALNEEGSKVPGMGTIKCLDCYLVSPHFLVWPEQAYYQWNIRGDILWAISREHASILLAFIASKARNPHKFVRYEFGLRKLPAKFLSAKVRDDVVKQISLTLKKEGLQL